MMNMLVEAIKALKNNDGLTLKKYTSITYKSGWQVATEGIETKSVAEVITAIEAYNGNCGVWFSDGIYYVDKSHRVATKREAMQIGRACNQISVLNWRTMGLAYCQSCFLIAAGRAHATSAVFLSIDRLHKNDRATLCKMTA